MKRYDGMVKTTNNHLAEVLDVLAPNLADPLVETKTLNALYGLVAHLPPISRGGFECRLDPLEPQVDLQLCVEPDAEDITLMGRWLAELAPDHPAKSPLLRLLDLWSVDGPSDQRFPELWLEFDCGEAETRVPALFFALPQNPVYALHTWPLAQAGLDALFGRANWRPWKGNLKRCLAGWPDGVFISHLGAMLSRQGQCVRVNIKRLNDATLPVFLESIGWPGDRATATHWAGVLLRHADRLTLSLDLGERLGVRLGLEAFFVHQPPAATGWDKLLRALIRRGLCDPAKAEALLVWPGHTTPLNVKTPWPQSWIATSLRQPANRFSTVERCLHHIKVGLSPDRAPEAKGYV
ncbi:MAG: hypothetical protein LGR52_14540 [Candidatus Thiosymbion ectosymbiont of Robbea hypermnestra]|nr:hypothetical protein [Candidatus Thiosymbion ectosymbiont of Robbea hypermnestra]